MDELRLGAVEARFADIVWANAPVKTSELIGLCAEALNWKRTTTYTVLKRLCERGLFVTEDSIVTALISRDEFYSKLSARIIEENYGGSLPSFISAYTSQKKLSDSEVSEIMTLIGAPAVERPSNRDIARSIAAKRRNRK